MTAKDYFGKLPVTIMAMPDLSNGAKVVYAGLDSFRDHDSKSVVVWRSIPALAKRVGLGGTQVKGYLRELDAAALVTVERRPGRVNRYTLTPPPTIGLTAAATIALTTGAESRPGTRAETRPGTQSETRPGRRTNPVGNPTYTRSGSRPTPGRDPVHELDPESDPVSDPTEPFVDASGMTEANHDARRLCDLLADLIERNGSKRPDAKRWLADAKAMLDKDGRNPAEAEHLIRWCQGDAFWRANILSMAKLRKQYDQLRLKAKGDGPISHNARILTDRDGPSIGYAPAEDEEQEAKRKADAERQARIAAEMDQQRNIYRSMTDEQKARVLRLNDDQKAYLWSHADQPEKVYELLDTGRRLNNLVLLEDDERARCIAVRYKMRKYDRAMIERLLRFDPADFRSTENVLAQLRGMVEDLRVP